MTIKIVSWNMNSDRRGELREEVPFKYTALAFPEYNIAERFPKIASSLHYMAKEKNISVFALQEVESSILPELEKFLSYLGYEVITNKYNPTKMAFNFVFAYAKNVYEMLETKKLYLTESGKALENRSISLDEIKKHNFDAQFERSVQVVDLQHCATKQTYSFVNIHFDLSNRHKLLAAQYLCNQTFNPNRQLIILGDGNQFDASVTEPKLFAAQIKIFTENGFQWIGEELLTKEPKKTFAPFAHDINRFFSEQDRAEFENLKKLNDFTGIRALFLKVISNKPECLGSTVLDTVFTKNIAATTEVSCRTLMFDNKGERIKKNSHNSKNYDVFLKDCYDNHTSPPSDHLPVLVKLRFT